MMAACSKDETGRGEVERVLFSNNLSEKIFEKIATKRGVRSLIFPISPVVHAPMLLHLVSVAAAGLYASVSLSPDSGLASLSRPITVSGLGEPATLRAQLDTAAQRAVRQAVRSTASQQQLEEAFVMQTSAGGRFDSIDEWDSLISSSWAFSDDEMVDTTSRLAVDDYYLMR